MDKLSVFGNAKYLKAEECAREYSLYDPAPVFRREFDLGSVEGARITVQSPGTAKYYINGQDITEDLFISAISDYNKILWYNVYDVSSLLRVGKNVISVICGNGFLNESFKSAWFYPDAVWRDAPKFCLSLEVGGERVLISDESWKCSKEDSYVIYNHIRSGEYHDMRKKSDDWMAVGFDDSDWNGVIATDAPDTADFRLTECQPMREFDRIEPQSITETESGYLLDFGVNTSGYLEVSFFIKPSARSPKTFFMEL